MVLGDSPIVNELNTIAQVKKVGSSAISVKKVQSVGEVTDCQIVYVSNSKSRLAPDVIARLQGKNVLIITDELIGKSGFGINFVVKDGKQAFEVSKGSIENNGLKINSGLLALGISVK
jgi:predicted GTPase